MHQITQAEWSPSTPPHDHECANVSAVTDHLSVYAQTSRDGYLTYVTVAGRSAIPRTDLAELIEAELTRELVDEMRAAGAAVAPRPCPECRGSGEIAAAAVGFSQPAAVTA